MIASVYNDTGETLTRLANAVIDAKHQATFVANVDWEITHYGVMETARGPSILDPLLEPVTVRCGNSLTLDLKRVTFEFTKLDTDRPDVIGAEQD